ncbi:GAF domain-containing sensor histidine kinase [Solirubrobacter sp. CPCC 204708]|uniref:Oxygen sensor histidine kinase NreB n=1 Tax=Solirubrobacter deserti TaxID=2282478 RepID=A0ABT4RUX4_9ACTN|nr:GAF domain-containing sensor histidine kinase [Solirubrobacter deserti]MBE2317920.1 GAF domain-containing sensor histidine kinase [Solirubrobacter deserti]MDA0142292.1 GAF domain-containing sensor histidine kinase [Solirubrobacter deserti]
MRGPALTSAALRGLLDATPAAIGCFDAQLRAVYANTAFTMATGVQMGRVIEDAALAAEVRAMVEGTGAPRRVRIAAPHRMPISGTLFALGDALIGLVLDAGAYEALAVLAEEQSALRRVATLVASDPEPEDIFRVVAEEAGRLLHARSAATIRYEGDFAVTVGRWADDDLGGFEVGTVVPLTDSDGVTALVARTGEPARVEDYRGVKGYAAEMMASAGYRSAVAAPVVVPGGRIWGVVLVASANVLGEAAEHRLAGFAELVALALESAEARAELKASRVRILEAGVTERRRLERNLHDGAQQRLVALAVQLRVLEKRLGEPDKAVAMLRAAALELEQALAELRELARGLHPAVLADRGLAPALETLASRSPLPVALEGVPEGRLAEPLEAAAYFVVAESLTNAVKHADATELRVRMATEAGELRVEISDDGRGGADPEAGGGTGLRGLADRVEALGGRLTLESTPGAGTTVRAALPLGQT